MVGRIWLTMEFSIGMGRSGQSLLTINPGGGGGTHTHTLPIRVLAAQRGRDYEAPDLERGIHFRGGLPVLD